MTACTRTGHSPDSSPTDPIGPATGIVVAAAVGLLIWFGVLAILIF
jgi:hypothetical protein